MVVDKRARPSFDFAQDELLWHSVFELILSDVEGWAGDTGSRSSLAATPG